MPSLNAAAQEICKRYTCSICVDKSEPQVLGSGTVIVLDNYAIIATAMHVVEGYELDQLRLLSWYPDDERRFPIPQGSGQFRDESIDIAVLTMSREVLNGSSIQGLSLTRIDPGVTHDPSDHFLLCGCPRSLSKFDKNQNLFEQTFASRLMTPVPLNKWPKRFEARVAIHCDPFEPSVSPENGPTRIKKICTDRQRDVFLDFGKDWYDPDFLPLDPTDPAGFSGGGIWRIPSSRDGGCLSQELALSGFAVAVEKTSWKWIRGIQMQYWLEMLWTAWPGLQPSIISAGFARMADNHFTRQRE